MLDVDCEGRHVYRKGPVTDPAFVKGQKASVPMQQRSRDRSRAQKSDGKQRNSFGGSNLDRKWLLYNYIKPFKAFKKSFLEMLNFDYSDSVKKKLNRGF